MSNNDNTLWLLKYKLKSRIFAEQNLKRFVLIITSTIFSGSERGIHSGHPDYMNRTVNASKRG